MRTSEKPCEGESTRVHSMAETREACAVICDKLLPRLTIAALTIMVARSRSLIEGLTLRALRPFRLGCILRVFGLAARLGSGVGYSSRHDAGRRGRLGE